MLKVCCCTRLMAASESEMLMLISVSEQLRTGSDGVCMMIDSSVHTARMHLQQQ